MTQSGMAVPPFDIFSVSEDVRERFGWSNEDLNKVMEQLVPAAMNGYRYFGSSSPGIPDDSTQTAFMPFPFQPTAGTPAVDASLLPFFGPEPVQQALAAQVSALTGLNSEAIQTMMPVAATLAMGQVARPFVQGEARTLLDAFMRGFARGRPKPRPTPVDYLQGYTDAMMSFWGSFAPQGGTVQTSEEAAEVEEDVGAEDTERQGSEFDDMISGWMDAGRNFQSSQFKAFDSLFEKASKDT